MNFKKLTYLCMQRLTNFPYIEEDFDALTNYELLCKVVEYLNKVIANDNLQNEAITELATSFTELKNYVDNLDLQDEVNNKLDEMYENGQLDQIIEQYLVSSAIWGFNTVSDMKQATNLIDGSFCKTLGYHSINDGGNAFYKIRTITNADVVDEGAIIALQDETLVAELIQNGTINPNMFGAYGDGIHDDLTSLNNCKSYAISNKCLMSGNPKSIYALSNTFEIVSGFSCDFKNATFKALNTMTSVIKQHKTVATTTEPVHNEFTKNIIIDCDNKADYGFYQDELGWSLLTENIRVLNPHLIGIYIKKGQIRLHNCKIEQENEINCIGLQVDSSDSEYYNIVTRDCSTGIKVTGSSNGFYECHPVMFKTSLLPNSIAFDLNAWGTYIHPIADTFEYAFYIRHNGGVNIIGGELVINTDYYNDETMTNNPYFIYCVNTTQGASRIVAIGSKLSSNVIVNNNYAYFTNVENWNSGNMILDNPCVAFLTSLQGIPKEINQVNSYYNLSSYLQTGYTASTMGATINGNSIEYRMINITLPSISKDSGSRILDTLPLKFVPSTNKNTNVITKNGVTVVLSTNTNGYITITPISSAITSGDVLYFTGSFIK